ncbi:MAG TPA: hypothetical protein VH024_17570 [Candidatus Angelobacter sp.]|nr:hypothetical protein [Candidatus Angelobacter sp.]
MAVHMPFASLPPPPRNINWYADVGDWPMLMNNIRGNCVIAAAGHYVQQVTTYQDAPRIMTDAEADTAYQAVNNWTPTAADTVGPGTYVLGPNGLLQYWRTKGLMIGGALHRCGPAARVDIRDEEQIAQAIDVFGGLLVGVTLREDAYNADFLMDSPGGRVISGHEVWVNGLETLASGYRVYDIVSWGMRMRITGPVLQALIEEAQIIIDTDDMAARGHDPADVPIATLEATMATNFPSA